MLNTSNVNKPNAQWRALVVKKAILILITVYIIAYGSMAAQAQTISSQKGLTTQMVVRNAAGEILGNQNISLRISIRNATVNGTILYQETQSATSNLLGLVNLVIGQGTIIINTLNPDWGLDPSWATASKFMQIEMDATGGTTYINMGTTQLLSVPYAMYATTAGRAVGAVVYAGTWDANANTPNLTSASAEKGSYYVVSAAGSTNLNSITDWNVGDWAIYNGTAWEKVDNSEAPVEADNVAITPIPTITATNVQDAIEELNIKVDDNQAIKLNISGGTMTGNLILNADPTAAMGAATKKYVDDATTALDVSNKADKVTGATAGNFATLNTLGNLTDSGKNPDDYITKSNTIPYAPSADYHPATKKYVDDAATSLTAGNVAFAATAQIPATNVQDAITTVQSDFANLIDSYIHKTDDGVSIYLPPGGTTKRFGIGVTTPASPLGIKAEGASESLISFHDAASATKWNMNMNPAANANTGFNIEQVTTAGNVSRLFIQEATGMVGLGTIAPEQKLHVKGANDGGNVSVMVENLESGIGTGWLMSALDDNAITSRNNTFAIHEKKGSSLVERITVLSTSSTGIKNVGINEALPFATLHVTKPATDPLEPVNLSENTGILCLGQIDNNNLVMDSRQIQARQGTYIGTQLNLTASQLKLQPYGGGLTINSSSASSSDKVTITTNGKMGLGTLTPVEKIDIDGAIKIGNTTTQNPGTLRWSGADFEGYDGANWKSLTHSFWSGTLTLGGAPAITYNVANPKVGIGVAQPAATLDLRTNGTAQNDMVSLNVESTCENISPAPSVRIGTKILSTGQWSTNALSKDIGIYVSNISGQASASSNLAAVLNGNVSIGDLTSSSIIGTNGSRVLAIQNGTAPTTAISGSGLAADGGIQLYSQSNTLGTSTFHVMNGDGTIIKLFRAAALTPANNAPVSSTYDPAVLLLIENMRNRINELESKLQSMGLLD